MITKSIILGIIWLATARASKPANVTNKCGVFLNGLDVTTTIKDVPYRLCANATNPLPACSDAATGEQRSFTVTFGPSFGCPDDTSSNNASKAGLAFKKAVFEFQIRTIRGATKYKQWQLFNIVLTNFVSNDAEKFGQLTTPLALIDAKTIEIENVIDRAVGCGRTIPVFKPQAKIDPIKVAFRFSRLLLSPYNLVDTPDGHTFAANSTVIDDCVPMLTTGSWMGIMVGLLLLAVFLFALSMLSELSVMDRFDDPKGKPLQINVKNE